MGCLSLRETDDHLSVEAVLEQPEEGDVLDTSTIQELLAYSGFAAYKPEDEAIHQLLDSLEQSEERPPEFPITLTIARKLDAQLSLKLSPDKLFATATIQAAYGGRAIDAKQIKEALSAAHICKGIRTQEIGALLKAAQHAKPGKVLEKVIACGKQPEHGRDGEWIADVQSLREQLNQPTQREDGTVDLLDFGEIMTVKEGELLMHLEPPTPGKIGFTVTGEVIPPKPGKAVPFTPAEGVTLNKEKDQILATRKGLPVHQPRGIRVDQIYTCSKVDVGSGHITFDGSVIIQGDVEDSMKISATGDVTIGGSVYYAHIEAGGDIIVKNGVIGRQLQDQHNQFNSEDINCTLKAAGHIQIGFAQYAHLEAGTGISAEKQLLHCMSHTPGLMEIGKGPRDKNSKLIGGISYAGSGIRCANYGTEAFIPTEIRLCFEQQSKQHEQELIEKLNSNAKLLKELKLLLPKLRELPKSDEHTEKIRRLVSTIEHTSKLISTLKHQIRKLRVYQLQQRQASTMLARGEIFPNVKVYIAEHPFKFIEACSGGGVSFQGGEVCYDPSLRET